MMERLQICVRMTDGISFSLSPIATATKGLLKQQRIQQKKARQRSNSEEEAHSRPGMSFRSKVLRPKRPNPPTAHLIAFHTLKPSSGLVPLVLPPARPTNVGSQSEMWMSSRLTVPGCSSRGLATNPTPRTPPSHSDHFLPRRGQLLPP